MEFVKEIFLNLSIRLEPRSRHFDETRYRVRPNDLMPRFSVSRNRMTRGMFAHLRASLNIPGTKHCSSKRPRSRTYNADAVDIYGRNSESTHNRPRAIPRIYLSRTHARIRSYRHALIKFIDFAKSRASAYRRGIQLAVNLNVCGRRASTMYNVTIGPL